MNPSLWRFNGKAKRYSIVEFPAERSSEALSFLLAPAQYCPRVSSEGPEGGNPPVSGPSLPCKLVNLSGEWDESEGLFLGVQIGH